MERRDKPLRSELLDKFVVASKRHYDSEELPCSIASLLAKLVEMVPEQGLDQTEPKSTVALIGEIDPEKADCLISDLWGVHYYTPIETPLLLLMACSGGDVDGGSAIASVLADIRRDGRLVHIHVAGAAMSTAFDILQCADHRSCEPTALLMTHHERFGIGEDDAVKHVNEGSASINRARLVFEQLSLRTGRPAKYYLDKIKGVEWYITPEEALREGLIDEIAISRPFPLTPARDAIKSAPRRRRTPKQEETPPSE